MNKLELAAYIADQAGISQAAAQKALDATFEGITMSLQKGDDVRLVGFGTFSKSHRKAREGRNPATGEAIKIAASNQAKFSAGKALKDAVNDTATTAKTGTK